MSSTQKLIVTLCQQISSDRNSDSKGSLIWASSLLNRKMQPSVHKPSLFWEERERILFLKGQTVGGKATSSNWHVKRSQEVQVQIHRRHSREVFIVLVHLYLLQFKQEHVRHAAFSAYQPTYPRVQKSMCGTSSQQWQLYSKSDFWPSYPL